MTLWRTARAALLLAGRPVRCFAARTRDKKAEWIVAFLVGALVWK